jgi:16S rRNA A1518/A1519 N6-dimethyltransferase RsmA/KsgA/DIM1 with predicted DNA glycosylase/AP lyase activity
MDLLQDSLRYIDNYKKRSVLEIGIGNGKKTKIICSNLKNYYAIESNIEMYDAAKKVKSVNIKTKK